MWQKYENELKQGEKEQREPKQLIANKEEILSSLAILMEWFRIFFE